MCANVCRLNTGAASVVWVASMAYSDPQATSNRTEYFSLHHELCYAKLNGCAHYK